MAEDKQDQSNVDPKPDDSAKKTVTISADQLKKFNDMADKYGDLSNTVKNLSTKMENHQKAATQKAHTTTDQAAAKDDKQVDPKYDALAQKFNDLNAHTQKLEKQTAHGNVLKHAHDALKQNGMKVSADTFNQLLGRDNQETDQNINWFKPIYKKMNSKPTRFPHASHHIHKEETIGAQLAKEDEKNNTMRPLNDCFKN